MSAPYASHLPVLRAVLATYKPKRVLELGSGPYSTPLFLDAGVKLTSLETDDEWFMKAEAFADFDLRLVENVAESLPLLIDFDLVFVDDSHDLAERERTIRAVLSQSHPLTVLHDAEVREYRAAITELSDCTFICTVNPHVAIAFPDGFDRRYDALLEAINKEL